MEILLFLPLLLILMYVLLIRPQQQRVRQQQALLSSIEVGDEVVTVSGIVGVVDALDDDRVYIEVAPGVTIAMLRQALSRKLEPPVESDESDDEPADDEAADDEAADDEAADDEAADDGIEKPASAKREGPEEIAG